MKGNMFLGYARGKVGDVVFYRQNGEQLARARNRNPRNPNSVQQRYARAIVATVSLAYSAGSRIFNHSFQGRSVGQENQRKFMQINISRLRAQLADEMEDATVVRQQSGMIFVKPKAGFPVANLYRVSEGTMPMRFFTLMPPTSDTPNGMLVFPVCTKEDTVATYCGRVGLVPGDIYTFVVFADSATDDIPPTNQIFAWARLTVKPDVLENTEGVGDFRAIFEVAESFGVSSSSQLFRQPIEVTENKVPLPTLLTLLDNNYQSLTMAVIRSAYDNSDRSTSEMVWCRRDNHGHLTSAEVPDAWAAASPIGDPELILEGSPL